MVGSEHQHDLSLLSTRACSCTLYLLQWFHVGAVESNPGQKTRIDEDARVDEVGFIASAGRYRYGAAEYSIQ